MLFLLVFGRLGLFRISLENLHLASSLMNCLSDCNDSNALLQFATGTMLRLSAARGAADDSTDDRHHYRRKRCFEWPTREPIAENYSGREWKKRTTNPNHGCMEWVEGEEMGSRGEEKSLTLPKEVRRNQEDFKRIMSRFGRKGDKMIRNGLGGKYRASGK